MATLPVQLNEPDLQKIDLLVRLGKYKNRSQALRELIHRQLEHETVWLEFEKGDAEEEAKKISKQLLNAGPLKFEWKNSKSAAELIREDRDDR